MNDLAIVSASSHAQLPSVLGAAPIRFPIGGKVRAGIMELTGAAAKNPIAKKLFEEGVAQRKSFDAIAAEIEAAVPQLKNGGLKPQNVPYFRVCPHDFAMPEVADLILEKYGEDRGEGVRRLYRFPAVFPGNTWEAVMPHALRCFGTSQLKFWSEYSSDGTERYCMQYAAIAFDPASKRPIRAYGGRKAVRRSDNEGRCEPERCREYQARQCNLKGSFIFLIPGIPMLSAVELPTNSFYSMNAARQKLAMVAALRGGSIAGRLGKEAFWFTKQLREVSMIDPQTGTPTRVKQWLIELEAPVDLTGIGSLGNENGHERVAAAERAVAVLNGAASMIGDSLTLGHGETRQTSESTPEAAMEMDGTEEPYTATSSDSRAQVRALRQRTYELTQALAIDADQFSLYAKQHYGLADWSTSVEGLNRAIEELQAHQANPEPLRVAIENELGM